MRRVLVIVGILVVLAAAVGVTYSAFSSSTSNSSNSLAAASSFVGCDYSADVLGTSGVVSYWRLGETSGTSAADSKGSNTGTITGGVTLNQTGLIAGDSNKSMSFNGTSGYVNVPYTAGLNPANFTVEGWIINPGGSSVREIVATNDPGFLNLSSKGYKLYADGSSWQFHVGNNTLNYKIASASTGYVAGALTHVVGTYDGSNLRLYINGALAATTASATNTVNTANPMRIGANANSASEFFSGRIDEAAVYNSALGASTVQDHFRCGQRYRDVILDTSGLVSLWRLGEPAGTVSFDSKGTNNGTYNNGVTLGAAGNLTAPGDTSASFDGVDDYASVPDAASLRPSSLSVEAWLKYNTGAADRSSALSKSTGDSWNDGYGLYLSSGQIKFFVNDYSTHSVGVAVSANTWTHIVGTYDGSTLRIYKDGQLASSQSYSASLTHSMQPLLIGRAAGTGYYWPGNIEDVAIYSSVLSATDVLQHHNAR